MDILDKLVALAQIRGSIDVQCSFRGGWHVRHEAKHAQGLAHIVTRGSGYVKLDGETQARSLKAGDVVFFPRTAAHVLSSEIGCTNTQAAPQVSRQGAFTVKTSGFSGSAELDLFCARFEYDPQSGLMRGLPDVLALSVDSGALGSLVSLLQYEAAQNAQGTSAVIDALALVLLVLTLRTYLQQNEQDAPLTGILNGWRDRRLRAVVQAVTDAPEREWRVEDMAETAKLSRAQLMRLFRSKMETSPHAFLTAMRLQKAALMLRASQSTVLAVALESGFQSETHFGKAFKKYYGCTPKQYRKDAALPETAAGGGTEYVI